MAKNSTFLADGDGQFNDWIEIRNSGTVAENTAGYALTDDPADLTKWPLPARVLAPGESLLVFCSGQTVVNYVDAASHPHTNFKLSDNGEFLALVAPDGITLTTRFFPTFPAQSPDVSYGLGTVSQGAAVELIPSGAPLNYKIPDAPITNWQGTAFSAASWATGNFPIGYDAGAGPLVTAYSLPANSIGTQTRAGSFGMDFDVSVPVSISQLGAFDSVGDGLESTITVQLYARNNNGTPANSSDDTGGSLLASATFSSADPGTLEGAHRFKSITPVMLPVGSYTISAYGYNIEKALNAGSGITGPSTNGGGALSFIRSRYGSAAVWPSTVDVQVAQYGAGTLKFQTDNNSAFATNLGSAMQDVNGSAYLRSEFTPPAGDAFTGLTLDIEYDDGFVAWLNGTEIARRNAPAVPAPSSTAPQAAKEVESINVAPFASLVVPGQPNVLAIQGLNVAADDADFGIDAQLTAIHSEQGWVYFTTPTPAAANGPGLPSPRIVINELHVDPVDSKSYPTEFVELYNPTESVVDLSGWAFTKGISYTFPAGTTLASHGYLLIAANPAMVLDRLGAHAIGPWTGALSNEGEKVTLSDALGAEVDSVEYTAGFPWPTVGDDPGPSLQLINEGLDNNLPGSWRPWPPTPGVKNTGYSFSVPPSVTALSHTPEVPASGQAVAVTARVVDPDGVSSVVLQYQVVEPGNYLRLTDAAYATSWTNVPMADSGLTGNGVYTAVIPASIQQHRRLIRYRVVATDETGAAVQAPLATEPCPDIAYFVYDGVPAWTAAVQPGTTAASVFPETTMRKLRAWHMISRAEDVQDSQYNPAYNDGVYHFEGALVAGGKVYDHIHYRVKGQNSTYNTGKNKWKLKFNTARPFLMPDDYGLSTTIVEKLNISSVPAPWAPWNRGLAGLDEAMHFRLSNLTGVPAPYSSYLQFRVIDGAEEQSPSSQYDGDFWGLYLAFENQGNPFKEAHGLPDGNIFRMQRTGDGNSVLGQGDDQPDDLSDLNAFLSSSTGYHKGNGTDLSSIQPEAWWRANVDLPRYYSWRAVNEAVNNTDIRDQENVVYFRDPDDGRWHLQPWDSDLLYEQLDRWGPQGTQNSSAYEQIRRALQHPAIAQEFRNRARELQDLLLNPDQAGKITDEFVSLITDEAPRIIPNGGAINPGLVEADRRRWDYRPNNPLPPRGVSPFGNYYRTPYPIGNMGNGPSQPFERVLASADFAGQVKWVKDFIGSDAHGGGRLAEFAAGQRDQYTLAPTGTSVAIPATPVISYAGSPGYPLDNLHFQTSAFSSPNSQAFAGIQWRIAECSWPGTAGFVAGKPWRYEIQETYTSAESATFASQFQFPPAALKADATYRVRVKMKDAAGNWSHWSAPVEFTTTAAGSGTAYASLAVSEIMYKPQWDGDGEFLELRNLSATDAIDLSSLQIITGINCSFPAGTVLAPGARGVIVKNAAKFAARYPGMPFLKQWNSGSLANEGETITIETTGGTPVISFAYGVAAPWPPLTSTSGSIVLKIPSGASTPPDHSVPGNWRASVSADGTPGTSDSPSFNGSATDDADGDGIPALVEYILGTGDSQPGEGAGNMSLVASTLVPGSFDFTLMRSATADDATAGLETSPDLSVWTPVTAAPVSSQTSAGVITEIYRFAGGSGKCFIRVTAKLK